MDKIEQAIRQDEDTVIDVAEKLNTLNIILVRLNTLNINLVRSI